MAPTETAGDNNEQAPKSGKELLQRIKGKLQGAAYKALEAKVTKLYETQLEAEKTVRGIQAQINEAIAEYEATL